MESCVGILNGGILAQNFKTFQKFMKESTEKFLRNLQKDSQDFFAGILEKKYLKDFLV